MAPSPSAQVRCCPQGGLWGDGWRARVPLGQLVCAVGGWGPRNGPGTGGQLRRVCSTTGSSLRFPVGPVAQALQPVVGTLLTRGRACRVLFSLARATCSAPIFFFGCLFVRAGIPLCFPQFGPGPLAQHGFARIATWEVVFAGTLDDGSVQTVMTISSDTDNEVIRQWGHAFTAEYAVTLSPTGLETSLRVVNTGTTAFDFTAAFHNYFAVTNVSEARVFGVESLPFQDRLADGATGTEAADGGAGYLVDKAVDKLYVGAPEELAVFDFGALKVLKIKKSATLPDVTLWNPFGEGGCDGGWKNFVCVEPAAAADKVVLEAGEEWLGAQLLGVE